MFDLDGTLADTLADIAASANYALAAVGATPRPHDEFRYLAGQGVDHLITHALGPEHQAQHAECKAIYLAHYGEHKYDHTGPFGGMVETLGELRARGIRLAVLSNKPDPDTQDVVRQLFGEGTFDAVRGARAGEPLKPDPTAALAIAAELSIPPDEWVYVGDTRVDMLTGRSAGMFTVGVLWGFRDREELEASGAHAIIAAPGELLDYVKMS